MEWVHQTPELAVDRKPSVLTFSDPFPADPMVAEREARDAAGVSEFRISGSSWYEAQRNPGSVPRGQHTQT